MLTIFEEFERLKEILDKGYSEENSLQALEIAKSIDNNLILENVLDLLEVYKVLVNNDYIKIGKVKNIDNKFFFNEQDNYFISALLKCVKLKNLKSFKKIINLKDARIEDAIEKLKFIVNKRKDFLELKKILKIIKNNNSIFDKYKEIITILNNF